MDWVTSYFFKVAENSRPASISNWKGVFTPVDRNVPRKPRLVGGVKGHNMNETSSPGSPTLWVGSFNPGASKFPGVP